MTRILGFTIIAFGLLACDTPSPAAPIADASTRTTMVDKLPAGTEVFVTFDSYDVPAGTTLMVKGSGSGEGATCRGFTGITLDLHDVTLVGGGSDPDGLRYFNSTFSTPMPPGTKVEITGRSLPIVFCGPYVVYRAIVVNGSGK